jgi:hypothetical protein
MTKSAAPTVASYLKGLPPERRKVVSAVRKVVRDNLPSGYRESMGWGLITYGIPLSVYPDTYNGQPLCYAALAAHKSYYTLYLMGAYADPQEGKKLAAGFRKRGLKLDMGKSCLHFKSLDDLPLDVIAQAIASIPPAKMIEYFEKGRRRGAKRRRGHA